MPNWAILQAHELVFVTHFLIFSLTTPAFLFLYCYVRNIVRNINILCLCLFENCISEGELAVDRDEAADGGAEGAEGRPGR